MRYFRGVFLFLNKAVLLDVLEYNLRTITNLEEKAKTPNRYPKGIYWVSLLFLNTIST